MTNNVSKYADLHSQYAVLENIVDDNGQIENQELFNKVLSEDKNATWERIKNSDTNGVLANLGINNLEEFIERRGEIESAGFKTSENLDRFKDEQSYGQHLASEKSRLNDEMIGMQQNAVALSNTDVNADFETSRASAIAAARQKAESEGRIFD
jgi:hypothetical protein